LEHITKGRPKRPNVKKPSKAGANTIETIDIHSENTITDNTPIAKLALDTVISIPSASEPAPTPITSAPTLITSISETKTATKAVVLPKNVVELPKVSTVELDAVKLRKTKPTDEKKDTKDDAETSSSASSSASTSASQSPRPFANKFGRHSVYNPMAKNTPLTTSMNQKLTETAEEPATTDSAPKSTNIFKSSVAPLKPPRPVPMKPVLSLGENNQATQQTVKLKPVSNGIKLVDSALNNNNNISDKKEKIDANDRRTSVRERIQMLSEESKA